MREEEIDGYTVREADSSRRELRAEVRFGVSGGMGDME